jgi:hypothetical protein
LKYLPDKSVKSDKMIEKLHREGLKLIGKPRIVKKRRSWWKIILVAALAILQIAVGLAFISFGSMLGAGSIGFGLVVEGIKDICLVV